MKAHRLISKVICSSDAHVKSMCSSRVKCHTEVVERLLAAHQASVLFFLPEQSVVRGSFPARTDTFQHL